MSARYEVHTRGKGLVTSTHDLDEAIHEFTVELGNTEPTVDPAIQEAVGGFVEREGQFIWGNSRIIRRPS